MYNHDGTTWNTDPNLFAALAGGQSLVEWFGNVPSFHDTTLTRLAISQDHVVIVLGAFRMTSEVDPGGYFVLDRHCRVAIRFSEVSGILIKGNASSIISELGVRRLGPNSVDWQTCDGPKANDLEVSIESVYGLEGAIAARDVSFRLIRD